MGLLRIKLNKPLMNTTYIERFNINNLLSDYNNYKMLLVSAPAGSGKSTVINAWIDTNKINYCWYSLDSSDNDIQQFLAYLIAGLEREEIFRTYQLSELLSSINSIGTEGIIHTVINVLYESAIPFSIVLDDYHLIHNQEIHNMLMLFIEHLPSHVHLVVITREDPPLPLSKLRVSRQLLEIRMQNLQFNDQETALFMSQTMGLTVSESHIKTLNARTEGWIAGLQLAAHTLQNHHDPHVLLEKFSGNHYIVDYLLEEVLNYLDNESTDFLIATSILSQFTSALCDYLLELPSGSAKIRITKLAQSNAFIIPLDHQRQWFRYHHLFRDLLVERLSTTDLNVEQLHLKASEWFNDSGHSDLAIHHALQANALDKAADYIENLWSECDKSLQAQRWLDKFLKLPILLVEKRPVLLMGYAWALLDTGQHMDAEPWLKKAQYLYDAIESGTAIDYKITDQVQYNLLPSTVASAYCYLAVGQGQFQEMFEYAKQAFNHKAYMTHHRSVALRMMLVLAHWSIGDLPGAKLEINRALMDIRKTENPIALSTYEIVRIELLVDTGKYEPAKDLLNKVINDTLKDTKLPIALASFHLIYSRLHLALGDIEQSINSLKVSKTYGMKYCLPDFWYKYYQQQATLQMHEGLHDSAIASLDEAETHYYLNPLPTRTSLKGLRGYIYILLNRFAAAAICFECLFAEQDLIYKSIYLTITNNINAAQKILAELYETASSQQRYRTLTEVQLGMAVLAKLNLQDDQCILHLNKAKDFINDTCYVEPLQRYQSILEDQLTTIDLTQQVRGKLSLKPLEETYTIYQANQQLPDPLTPRELEIIQLLADGYSNQEVCDKLFLALSTVKGYNQNLFGKLGVRRRTEAVSKAREIGLIH